VSTYEWSNGVDEGCKVTRSNVFDLCLVGADDKEFEGASECSGTASEGPLDGLRDEDPVDGLRDGKSEATWRRFSLSNVSDSELDGNKEGKSDGISDLGHVGEDEVAIAGTPEGLFETAR
jgi:hypothetical protein